MRLEETLVSQHVVGTKVEFKLFNEITTAALERDSATVVKVEVSFLDRVIREVLLELCEIHGCDVSTLCCMWFR